MNHDENRLLTGLLRQVSRSFYTTLRILPGAVRRQIGLAYLLARATDTIADTQLVPLDLRVGALRRITLFAVKQRTIDPLAGHSREAQRSIGRQTGLRVEG